MSRSIQPGSAIGRYRVVSLLGAGGMGEVYLARDESLDRSVALKILPPDLVKNEERVRRFVQEARSASSLSHPHIVAIHEIGEAEVVPEGTAGSSVAADRVYFIAMELVGGSTLKDLIHRDKTDLRTLVRYLSQAAEGLAKAHAAGIVHRDLKPENIMVTQDGYAKVLDFGLAKLTEAAMPGAADQASAPTAMVRRTGDGVILGTVGYMSPEQIQARPVDHRSDIFSFGCILYEAAARQRPFAADSDIETLHKILKEKPPPVEELNPLVPAEVRRLIRRCLAKSPDQRLQSMKDLAIELAEIAEEYDTLSVSSASGSATSMSVSGVVVRERSRWETIGIVTAIVIGVGGLAAGGWAWFHNRGGVATGSAAGSFADMQITQLANIPDLTGATLSRDGRYLAYTVNQAGRGRLVVRQIATGQDLDVVPAQAAAVEGPVFSPEGSYVFYVQRPTDGVPDSTSALCRVASVGGAPRRILEGDFSDPPTLSPDGSQIAAVRQNGTATPPDSALVVVNADGTNPKTLVTFPMGTDAYAPAWSPDGKFIVGSVYRQVPGERPGERLAVFSVADGKERSLGPREWTVWAVAWLPDGSGFVMSARDADSDVGQLWLVSWPDGNVRRITNDANDYGGAVSVSSDSSTIATVHSRSETTAWVAQADKLDAATRIAGERMSGFVPARNGRMLFSTSGRTRRAIWSMAADGTARQRLTPERLKASSFSVAALADVIAFTVVSDDRKSQMWRMDLDGSALAEVPGGANKRVSGLSPDGKTVFFSKESDNPAAPDRSRWKMPLAGGPEERVADTSRPLPTFSPDGRCFYRYPAETPAKGAPPRVEIVAVAGEKPLRTLEFPDKTYGYQWAHSSDALTFTRTIDGVNNIWRMPIDGRPAQQVTQFGRDQFGGNYAWTADGSRLFFTRAEPRSGEVLLIKRFR
jgi:serine/threonine protein kinase/Tol biopolymer transport system component